MTPLLAFNVFGTPAPQGSKNARYNPKTNKSHVYEQNDPDKQNWRQDVRAAALAERERLGLAPLDGPLFVVIHFRLWRPPSVSIRKRPFPAVKPDGDKLERCTWDALSQAQVWRDDAQVVNWGGSKRYATDDPQGSPGAFIEVGLVPLPVII
jgi:Holliday junction resolvase RusA-like endonuclease